MPIKPAAEQLMDQVQERTLPNTRALLFELIQLQSIWIVNGIEQQIAAAQQAGTLIAGYDPDDIWTLGEAMRQLQTAINTPVPTLGDATLFQVLNRIIVPAPTPPVTL